MKSAFLVAAFSLVLSGCAFDQQSMLEQSHDMTYQPLIDEAATGQAKMAVYGENKRQCFELADKRVDSEYGTFKLLVAAGAGDNTWQRKFRDTARRCLEGRGYLVLN